MKALVTGITGFVGQHLAACLEARGHQVIGLGLEPLPSRFPMGQVFQCDLLEATSLGELISRIQPEHVFHLAGRVQPAESVSMPRPYYEVNVMGTVNLLESLRTAGFKGKVLIVSSADVYGPRSQKEERIAESLSPDPTNPYAVSKWIGERIAIQYYESYGLKSVVARPFNHSGPGQQSGFVIPDFCQKALSGATEIQVGNLSPIRDFLDVRDVVEAYRLLIQKGRSGEVYNVSRGEGVSIGELLRRILDATGSQAIIHEKGRSVAENNRLVGDNSRLLKLGWKPQIPMCQTIADTLDYWRERHA